ncbi:hypothetical protein H1D32_08285 [Anaerobacillus sp. CMMVII]|uniref:hypothetical protein n=1 Tax=Anaerobacillus sp. CMMVII TaxID=2755588 RepID=UPI0021B6F236|nr:hypothetical protein [Anaerobacillus sp. CMMVII]MCT8137756.1 hypothetical protein [Anaerobacillus sp. CMMVII]
MEKADAMAEIYVGCCSLFLAILTYALFPLQQENYAYVIAIDINPSIELVLMKK